MRQRLHPEQKSSRSEDHPSKGWLQRKSIYQKSETDNEMDSPAVYKGPGLSRNLGDKSEGSAKLPFTDYSHVKHDPTALIRERIQQRLSTQQIQGKSNIGGTDHKEPTLSRNLGDKSEGSGKLPFADYSHITQDLSAHRRDRVKQRLSMATIQAKSNIGGTDNKEPTLNRNLGDKSEGSMKLPFADYSHVKHDPTALIRERIQQRLSTPPIQAKNSNGETNNNSERETGIIQQKRENADSIETQKEISPNRTGLPDNLKTGVENLSGYSLDDVKVHYNSPKPAQLQAHAYTQGTDIHVASGQEKHLPHETWHVVQQMQGRVKPTMQAKGVAINDNPALEREADMMGAKAASVEKPKENKSRAVANLVAQKKIKTKQDFGFIDNRLTTVIQRQVSKEIMELWKREHDQTIPLDSGDENMNVSTVDIKNGDIKVHISEHANNHFVNRHTYKEFSFKDENIKKVNSFWPKGTKQSDVNSNAQKVILGLEDDIKNVVTEEGGGAVFSKNNTVAGMTVGYNITLEADDDETEFDPENNTVTYEKGSGNMNMFYPEGDDYTYYSSEELHEIKENLQKDPDKKTLQLRKKGEDQVYQANSSLESTVVQCVTKEEAKSKLESFFGEPVFKNFITALEKLEIDLNNIPDSLIKKLSVSDIPHFYLPSTTEIWQEFIKKILKYQEKTLSFGDMPKVDKSELTKDEKDEKDKKDEQVNEKRKEILKSFTDKSKTTTSSDNLNHREKKQYDQIKPLAEKILQAKLTNNFALDTLFKYTSPQMLNAFEILERSNYTSQNIKGELNKQRISKEKELFGLAENVDSRVRPRYAALNFHGYKYGAAARNDYGLSHMIFKDDVKNNATFTCGDTFETDKAYPLSSSGVEDLIWTLAKTEQYMFPVKLKLLEGKVYTPADTYFDVQIHQDIDLRKDVSKIIVSRAEMRLFNIDIELVNNLISQLAKGLTVEFI
ncbi:DUF4157 domain-containing protein [Crocosphaera sp.]|uniref:eCIS core domain-containing protein n=1 Tax=Crocosphaera sp. TaxID=2729996 RepID=UPI002637F94C|nr:DUF4157 domain-containing protein [Crocosphaera sp.]MDJ0579762.1 DUF3626 domain-containing protein [Crocosphaera sp.]